MNVNSSDILRHLTDIPGMSLTTARELLNPADKQNVPKAVRLVQQLVALRSLPRLLNPTESQRRLHLVFLARTLDYFVSPFTKIELSLSQQICSLSTYAHITVAMYLKHRLGFLTGALYADSLAIVKNIVICVARLQLVDSDNDVQFYIILEGTNQLETIFSDVRTQDHSRNFDVLQLSQKLSVAAAISATFERHPGLNRGHRKLALKDAEGVDHINPRSWTGNVRVRDVELAAEWIKGQHNANALLREYFGASAGVDFDALWRTPGLDILRPLDPKIYVGSQWSPDDERSERCEDTVSESAADVDDEEFDDVPVGMDIEDFLENDAADSDGSTTSFDKFLSVEGKMYMKSSVVTSMLGSKRKVILRTLRAQGLTLEDLRKPTGNWNSAELLEGDIIKAGDLAACLVRSGETICLAILEITSFEYHDTKRQVTSMKMDEFEHQDQGDPSQVTVLVQIMDTMDATNDNEWIWNRRYIRFETGKKRSADEVSTRRNFVLRIPSKLVYPLAPSIVSNPSAPSASGSEPSAQLPDTDSLTWSLKYSKLEAILDHAWLDLDPDTDLIIRNVELLPQVTTAALPYLSRDGKLIF